MPRVQKSVQCILQEENPLMQSSRQGGDSIVVVTSCAACIYFRLALLFCRASSLTRQCKSFGGIALLRILLLEEILDFMVTKSKLQSEDIF